MSARRAALLSLLAAAWLAPAARGQARTPVTLDGVVDRPGVDLPQITWLPDSDRILFTLGHYYEPQKTVILSTKTGERREITGLQLNFGGSVQLSPDKGRLAYVKEGAVWTQPLDGSEAPRQVAKLDLALSKSYDEGKVFCFGEDEKTIYFTQRPKRPEKPKPAEGEPTAIDFDPDAKTPLPLEIFRLDVPSGESRRIATVDADIRNLTWDPRASELHVLAIHAWGYNEKNIWSAILALDPKTGRMRDVLRTAGGSQAIRSNFSPDGKWIATTYDTENVIYDFRQHVVLLDPRTGRQTFLAPNLHVGDDLQWFPDSKAFLGRALIRGYNGIFRFGLDGSVKQVEAGERYVVAFALSPDGKRYASLTQDGYGRVEIRLTDADGTHGRVLETIDDPTREFAMGEFRVVSWPSFDGLEIAGYEVRPPNFDPKKKYPMLVDVHGGGPGSRLYLMGGMIGSLIERHLWAARGFVVFVPDYRTAAPYGPGVIEKLRGKSYSVVDVQDVMAGVDWMVSRGYVDPDRVALLGQSAGAHRANVLLPRTKRFRVAISNEGWANGWIVDSTGENTGRWEWPINVWFFKGTRMENPQAYFDEDPLQHLHEVRTPTLLIAGSSELGGIGGMTNEYFFSMLKRAGVDTKLIQFPDEGHGTTKVANRRFLMQAAIDWVEKHLPSAGGTSAAVAR
jgi:dipeptidyl aminopeptidase/acylaminoacyl peptidase